MDKTKQLSQQIEEQAHEIERLNTKLQYFENNRSQFLSNSERAGGRI